MKRSLILAVFALLAVTVSTSPADANNGNPPTECAYSEAIAGCVRPVFWVDDLPDDVDWFVGFDGAAVCADVGYATWCVEVDAPDAVAPIVFADGTICGDDGTGQVVCLRSGGGVPVAVPVPAFTG